jgi:hypothetical protein
MSSPIKGTMYSHRIAWILSGGEPISGRRLQRTCAEPGCVNPAHYSVGGKIGGRIGRRRKSVAALLVAITSELDAPAA